MVEVTIRKLGRRKAAKSKMVKKSVPTPSGGKVTIRSIPADSPAAVDSAISLFRKLRPIPKHSGPN